MVRQTVCALSSDSAACGWRLRVRFLGGRGAPGRTRDEWPLLCVCNRGRERIRDIRRPYCRAQDLGADRRKPPGAHWRLCVCVCAQGGCAGRRRPARGGGVCGGRRRQRWCGTLWRAASSADCASRACRRARGGVRGERKRRRRRCFQRLCRAVCAAECARRAGSVGWRATGQATSGGWRGSWRWRRGHRRFGAAAAAAAAQGQEARTVPATIWRRGRRGRRRWQGLGRSVRGPGACWSPARRGGVARGGRMASLHARIH